MEFQILGPVEAREGGRPLRVSGAKERAVLAFLLLHPNELILSDRIIDEVWGGDAAEAARNSLRVRVSELRKALRSGAAAAGELIESRGGGYILRLDPGKLDLLQFERLVEKGRRELAEDQANAAAQTLRAALALWRGPALADVAYEPFAQAAIARLEELRLAALELRIEADLALGLHAELVGELWALVTEHPLRERLRAQLMLALYRSGRQGEALEVYRDARAALVADLGLEPSPVLRSLEQAILRQNPILDLAPVAGRPEAEAPDRSILVLMEQGDESVLALGEALARRPLRELILATLVADEAALPDASRFLLESQVSLAARGLSARSAAFTSSARGEDVGRLAAEQDVDLLLAPVTRSALGEGRFSSDTATLLARAPCDVALFVAADGPGARPAPPGPVLASFGGSEHDWAAVELAAWIARSHEVPLRLLGRSGDRAERDASRTLARASLAVQRALGVAAEPLLVSGTEDILAATESAGLLVIGLSTRWRREGLGAVRLGLVLAARPPVILTRRGLRPGGLAPRETLTRFTWSLGAVSA